MSIADIHREDTLIEREKLWGDITSLSTKDLVRAVENLFSNKDISGNNINGFYYQTSIYDDMAKDIINRFNDEGSISKSQVIALSNHYLNNGPIGKTGTLVLSKGFGKSKIVK
jgi:hypothetical protein